MANPFLAEIRIASFNFAPKGWALCNGQTLPINQNQALFALLGTTYGGNGQTTFALPDLRSRLPMHMGAGFTLGQRGGEETHTLTPAEMAAHSHQPLGDSGVPNQASPVGNVWATQTANGYTNAPSAPVAMDPRAVVATTGTALPHENRPPFTVLNFIIALQGIFPSQF